MTPATKPIVFAMSRIENMMYQVTFDPVEGSGVIAANVSIIRDSDLDDALFIFESVMKSGLGVGSYIRVILDRTSFGNIRLESHECAIITPCSITIDSVLLKSGVPVRPLLGGIVQIKKGVPTRFTDILGSGKILANVRVVPMHARERVEGILLTLKLANFDSILCVSEPNTDVLGVPIERDHIGIVAIGGTNPMAAVQEQGIPIRTQALSELIDIDEMEMV
jgi:repressor of nif and glnA expression